MKLDTDLIRRLEALARLELTESERRRLGADLTRILDYVAQIDSLDTDAVEATTHIGEGESFREDRTQACLPRDRFLSAAPRSESGYFQVPPVIEGDGDLDHA